MPAVINSAPDCIVSNEMAEPADDSADFILQANFEDCAGFGTFMPGSTYGEDGSAAEAAYYILTVLGIAVTLLALVAWIIYENRQLVSHVGRYRARPAGAYESTESTTPQPGVTREGQ